MFSLNGFTDFKDYDNNWLYGIEKTKYDIVASIECCENQYYIVAVENKHKYTDFKYINYHYTLKNFDSFDLENLRLYNWN